MLGAPTEFLCAGLPLRTGSHFTLCDRDVCRVWGAATRGSHNAQQSLLPEILQERSQHNRPEEKNSPATSGTLEVELGPLACPPPFPVPFLGAALPSWW